MPFINTIFLFCPPCLSTGSKEIFLYIFFCLLKGWRPRGGQSLGDMSPKKSSYIIDALPSGSGRVVVNIATASLIRITLRALTAFHSIYT